MIPDDWPATAHRGAAPRPSTEGEAADAPGTDSEAADAPGASLRAVIRQVLTPARAGLFLSRDDLARLGSALGFPLPALDRRIMLEHLFMAAGPAGLLPRLFDLLIAEAEDWIATYAAWEQEYPRSAAVWSGWRQRAEALRTELADLRTHAVAVAPAEDPPR
jgi:hypothetical protein